MEPGIQSDASVEQSSITSVRHAIASRFSLLDDKADDAVIDLSLRSGVELRGATPWILIFAILIASIGLNVNSTAVIIGAMLVSPLMGPIIGIGYGVGIYDFALIRRSLFNLGIATVISLSTSTLYFLLTPLSEAQSELLSRTMPTIWDVLIALCGGLAGIIGATRRERSNVIPGVAIATALMPPLCTAGYGLANGNWSFFFGAFYLFSINCVFIAVATVVVVEFLRLPRHEFVNPATGRRVKRLLFVVVMLTALPSIYLAYRLVTEELFDINARQFIKREFQQRQTHVTEMKISASDKRLELTLIGDPISQPALREIENRLAEAGLPGARIVVHQAGDNRVDVSSLKAGILNDIYQDSQNTLRTREQQIEQLKLALARRASWLQNGADIAHELTAQFPLCQKVVVGEGVGAIAVVANEPANAAQASATAPTPVPSSPEGKLAEVHPAANTALADSANDVEQRTRQIAMLSAKCERALTDEEKIRIENWFQARTKAKVVRMMIDAPAAPEVAKVGKKSDSKSGKKSSSKRKS